MIVVGVPTVVHSAARRDRNSSDERFAAVRTRLGDAGRWVRERAHHSPLLALGVTVAAGFVLGRILSGRR